MTISAALVKTLRERTGSGMMECKKALVEANGDLDKAVDLMRASGAAKADKKAGRTAAEGVIITVQDPAKGAIIIEINSETDFVARDEMFNAFAKQVAACALAIGATTVEALLNASLGDGTVDEARKALIAKIGENVNIRRLSFIPVQAGEVVGAYSHGGRIAVLVQLKGGNETLAKDIAMHITASNPLVTRPEEVPADLIEKEKSIFVAQASQSGKPAEIIDKMIQGRIKKYLAEVSLLGQMFVKDPNMTIEDLLKKSQADVIGFIRYEVGEGIEKKVDNFVEEVMAQARGE
jgi:elongation factor Ts